MTNDVRFYIGMTLEELEKQATLFAFKYFDSNKTRTSQSLGIAIRTLEERMKKYDDNSKQIADSQRADQDRRNADVQRERDTLARMQGPSNSAFLPNNTPNAEGEGQDVSSAGTGLRVEPAAQAPAQHSVSMPEQKKVQTVLPQQTPKGGHNGRR